MGTTWENIFHVMPVKPIIDKIIVISIYGTLPSKRDFR
jgi:hypothetical protein